jgi:signal peptidase II
VTAVPPSATPGPEAGPPPSLPPSRSPTTRLGLTIAAGFVLLDQATKELAETVLVPGRFVPFLGDSIGWQLVYNPGGAFGVPAPSWLFLGVTVVVTVIVLRALPRTSSLLQASAYGMLLSGAIGNVLDRIFRPGDPDGGFGSGYVVDFVAWGTFPRFNVADSAITVGFVLLVIALFLEERRPDASSEVASAPEAASAADGASAPDAPGPPVAESERGSVSRDDDAGRR